MRIASFPFCVQVVISVTPCAAAQRSRRRGLIATIARVTSLFRSDKPLHDLEGIEQELHLVDETLHNIDICIVQIEGKLLLQE